MIKGERGSGSPLPAREHVRRLIGWTRRTGDGTRGRSTASRGQSDHRETNERICRPVTTSVRRRAGTTLRRDRILRLGAVAGWGGEFGVIRCGFGEVTDAADSDVRTGGDHGRLGLLGLIVGPRAREAGVADVARE